MKFQITHDDGTIEVKEFSSVNALKKSLKPTKEKYKSIVIIDALAHLLGKIIVLASIIIPLRRAS